MENLSELESTIWRVCMLVPFVAGALSMVYLMALAGSASDASHESSEEDYG